MAWAVRLAEMQDSRYIDTWVPIPQTNAGGFNYRIPTTVVYISASWHLPRNSSVAPLIVDHWGYSDLGYLAIIRGLIPTSQALIAYV